MRGSALAALASAAVAGGFDLATLEARNTVLYDELRRSFMIDILEDAIEAVPAGLDLELRNTDGDRYLCSLPGLGGDADEDPAADDHGGHGERSGDADGGAGGDRLAELAGRCDVLNLGWWSYEWCHEKSVRQFHVDQQAGIIDPQWSLGEFSHRDGAAAAAAEGDEAVDPAVDVFTGGQHCDETGQGRATRVEFRCCAKEEQPKKAGRKALPALAVLASIREPETCTYEATVCTPLLCAGWAAGAALPSSGSGSGGVSGGGGGSSGGSALKALEPLKKLCLSRHDGWWSYELCYGRHVRQFHLEQGTDEKGKPATRVTAEFMLGLAPVLPPPAAALRKGATSAEKAAAKAAAVTAEAKFIVKPPGSDDFAPAVLEVTAAAE